MFSFYRTRYISNMKQEFVEVSHFELAGTTVPMAQCVETRLLVKQRGFDSRHGKIFLLFFLTSFQITVEVNFTDNFFHQQPRDQNKVVLPHCQIYAIEVARILYKKYYGQK